MSTTSNSSGENKQAERVLSLVQDLAKLKKDKKDTVAGYNEEIKRIEKEIQEILDSESESG